MKRVVFLLIILATTAASSVPLRDWENPAVFARNQLDPRTPSAPFDDVRQALERPYKQSPYLQLLNGVWKFYWAPIPEESPADFYKPEFDASGWGEIRVPGNWQMQGYGHPKFRNVHQPFKANPPYPPSDYNDIGLYRRTFQIPNTWKGRRILLHFEGVKSAAIVYVNGRWVGYDDGGMEPSEYDITDYLIDGDNLLAVQVLRYSDGTYLECQDMWRLSGIFRDVYLLAVPQVYLHDFFIRCDLDRKYRDAELMVDAEIRAFKGSPAGYQLRVNLYDASGKAVFSQPVVRRIKADGRVTVKQKVENPAKWSAEKPNLYRVSLELLDSSGRVVEAHAKRFGFRKVEVIDQAICINGVPVKFNGVNSHMHHPVTGRAMDVETMIRDLTLMKQFNINLVRTSHYPPNVEYLDLADELGMYIVDETNDEAHATEYLSEDPAWRPMYVDRAVRMVRRDRNHPCIVFWSAGNESGSGDNIAALIQAGKQLDPTRIWMYGGNDDLLWFEDIVGPRYPSPDDLLKNVAPVPKSKDPRPSFMDEYQAATGNSLGLLTEYWDAIWKYPRLSGGAVWDWVSPGILQPARFVKADPGMPEGFVMGNAQLVTGRVGKAIALSGHDEWVEIYRDPRLDLRGDQLSLSLWVYPRRWNGCCPLITKGDHCFGLEQVDRDTLEFYIHSGRRMAVKAPLPIDWPYRWHHVAAVYDGSLLRLYIDGRRIGESPAAGRLDYSAHAVAIGKNTERHGQEHDGELCNAVIDQVRIYDRAVDPQKMMDDTAEGAVLRLDFEEIEQRGEFFSLGIGGRTYGLVWPDRRIQPELYELKKVPQPIQIEWADWKKGEVRLTNRYAFTDLNELVCTWKLQADDKTLQGGGMRIDLAPWQTKVVRFPYTKPRLQPGCEYRLLISFTLPEATRWAEKGHEVAWEQLPLPFDDLPPRSPAVHAGAAVQVIDETGRLTLRGSFFEYVFDKSLGRLIAGRVNGRNEIELGPQMNVWRAPISNELENDWGPRYIAAEYRRAGLDRLEHHVESLNWRQEGDAVKIEIHTRAAADGCSAAFLNRYFYTVFPDGEIQLTHELNCIGEQPEWLPRVGLRLALSNELNQMQWYGRGPYETYPDRKKGAKIGIYSGSVEDQFVPYLIPQENGNKTDVRWLTITDRDGRGWFISGKELLNVSAHLYSLENLDRAWYPPQLQKDGRVHLYLDHQVTGVGCTPIKTLEPYRVKPGEYQYTVRMRPFEDKAESPEVLGRQAW